MQRKFLNPQDRKEFNRWLAMNFATYWSIALITALLVALSGNSRNGGTSEAQAPATSLAGTVRADR